MEGDSRGTNNRILGAKPPLFPYISPGIPLHVQQPIKLLKLFQAGSNYHNNWPAKGLEKPLKALGGPQRPYEALKGLVRTLGALKGACASYEVLKGIMRPLRALHGA